MYELKENENSLKFNFKRQQLRKYIEQKKENKWGVIRHPMVLNFVNERLLDCAFFYTLHVLAFAVFLLLLSSHIFSSTPAKDIAVTAFIMLFLFFMLLKGAIKARISHSISFWFVIAYSFNIITYAATFLYVWLPTIFSYDNYHEEQKKIVLWFLPILAIISAWVNFLYILRKSPYGIYIFMMVRILRSFGHIATIWIPTLIAFSFAFHLIMRDSGTEPWESFDKIENATVIQKLFVILQAITKTSTMMIGEVDANDILGTRQWIPSILVLVFEIITVILLMNLMIFVLEDDVFTCGIDDPRDDIFQVSLAVGDVSDLRNSAQEKLLKIKVNFVIEALQLSEQFGVGGLPLHPLHKRTTNNVLVIHTDGSYFSTYDQTLRIGGERHELITARTLRGDKDKAYQLSFLEPGMRVRVHPLRGRPHSVFFSSCTMKLVETIDSGIPELEVDTDNYEDCDGLMRRYAKWIIGLDWTGYIDM
ncbi:hypothetical protein NECAME_03850 [Necator americanus]|uniref:Ion transport domain-containing protein n=1 Tax=Necator americanus TaxID=51031 RepID=W2T2B9_NECAM|nr:hypothetical protein NECAME_03850 [Necator americanus]ETN75127.1 hypothetical protein NECAME_03850 [Necator americanus]